MTSQTKTKRLKSRTNRTNARNKQNKTKKRTYSTQDYNSGDGFLTTVWGPMMWSYLHTMSFNYPVNPTPEDKKHYRDFMINLQYVLPCKYCRANLTNNFKKMPISDCHMKNRDAFSRYVYNLHETVNKMLKKKSHLTYCEVRDRYENFRSRCTEEKPRIFSFKTMHNDEKEKEKEKGTGKEKEKGCTEPLYGKKSKCVIKIIPQEEKQETFQMDKKCVKSKTLDKH
jgi:hypothetical protein